MRKICIYSFAAMLVVGIPIFAVSKVDVYYYGSHEGLFLLKGENGAWLEVTGDLFPEDTDRFIYGHPFTLFKHMASVGSCNAIDRPCTTYECNEKGGRGFIKTTYPDGRKFLICLSRFKDSLGLHPSGLFLGGDLPPRDPDFQIFNKNETGMAYFDGKRYYHIWCNVNEGIADAANKPISPSQWQFLSSKVLENSQTDLTLVSRHRALVNGVPFTIERFLFYTVGDTFVTLVTNITNVGNTASTLFYVYGDEPWFGDFGTSAGNVGWLKDRIVTTEMMVDTKKNDYFGMFDYGNELAGEAHNFTKKANFIEWQHDNPPTVAYFANHFGNIDEREKVPLSSPNNRVIALQWGKLRIEPDTTFSFKLAVGMAANNPQTGVPVKPDTGLNK